MTSSTEQMKQALLEIRRLKRELEDSKAAAPHAGPVAIIGAGLRLPGGIVDLEGFDVLLADARSVISQVPPSRWAADDVPADLPNSARFGAFLDQVDEFDAEFFGISGTEAESMDPQQRLVLETGWEALEHAGHAPDSFSDKALGIFLGMANSDYGRSMLSDLPAIDPYFTSGSSFSVASGRLAYFLGARGPAVTLDTACSSSLVALHLASQALKAGECDMALAGGVNLILSPEVHVNFARASMLSPEGICKTFDADADGYVRGEGCIVFVLRRLDDALADGDRILAVIRGSAINQDGRSNGLTAPNGPSQEALIRDALKHAGVKPDAVCYVEAHGTGTSLGDPIEMNALARAYGRDRKGTPSLFVGSVKTNLGHLESAAGAAGVLKALNVLRSGRLPAHLNFQKPNPHIDWSSISVSVPTEAQSLPATDGPRLVGVSSFGFSGTNAHLILEAAPPPEITEDVASQDLAWNMFPLSARSPAALSELARRTAASVKNTDACLTDLCFTAADGRAHFAYRLAATVRDKTELAEALERAAAGQAHTALATGRAATGAAPQIAFLFTGQGAQHAGMGRVLYESQPVYRAAIDACSDILGDTIPEGLVSALHRDDGGARLQEPGVAQPALFALEFALAKLWMSFGVTPAAVCGHSLGEFVAATIAGIMPLEDALGLVAERGRLTAEAAQGGMMASVFAGAGQISKAISGKPGIEIAAYNGPENHVLSGPASELEPLLAELTAQGVRAEALRISFAAHCSLVEPVMERFHAAAAKVRYGKAEIPIVSNLTGNFARNESLTNADHWTNHLRQPVRFADGVATLIGSGITHFIEIGPHPVLSGMAADVNAPVDHQLAFLTSLRRDGPAGLELAASVARLYADGAEIDAACLLRGRANRRIDLPAYPFERTRHWHKSAPRPGKSRPVRAETSWSHLSSRLNRESERGPLGFDAAAYPEKWKILASLRRALIISLLRGAGLFSSADEHFSPQDVAGRLGATEEMRPLVERWLLALADSGDLEITDGQVSAQRPLEDPGLAKAKSDVRTALADNTPLADYVLHCADLLPRVVTGAASPLETLFPGGDFSLALGLYERSSTMRYMNGLAAAAVETIAASKPGLSILEAGAGTGGTTAAVLEALDGIEANYHYTDVSDLFLDRARDRFRDQRNMAYALFDLERPPEEQGFQAGAYDIVLASNAVHAVRNLPETLTYLRTLLRPGGALILVESTTHFAWFDVTTGLIEGWRHAEDDLRDDLALLDAPKWQDALLEAGFESADAWPRPGSAAEAVGQHLIVARMPADREALPGDPVFAPVQFIDTAMAADPEVSAALDAIADALPNERPSAIGALVRQRVVALLRRRTDRPPADDERLLDIGLDSLMAVQLRNTLANDLGIEGGLPTTLVFDYPTIASMSAFLADLTCTPVPAQDEEHAANTAKQPRADISDMTDEEVEALLLERLKK